MHNVLCLLLTPEACPSSRYAVYRMAPYLRQHGIDVTVSPFYSPAAFDRKWRGQQAVLDDLVQAGQGCLRRVKDMIEARRYDAVWIHRFATPVGTGFIGSVLKVLAKPVVFDYDDAVHMPVGKGGRYWFGSWNSINGLIARSNYVVAWNRALGDHAKLYNSRVAVLPPVLDIALYDHALLNTRPRETREGSTLVLGWIGTPATAPYLEEVRPVLEELGREGPVELRVIGGDMADLKNVCVKRVAWRQETEIYELAQMDVSIAPMPDSEWTRGKSGYKVLQYMGCGRPVVASAVGAHLDLVEPGVEGYLAESDEEWLVALRTLRDNPTLRQEMGDAGRRRVRLRHDYPVVAKALADVLIQACLERG